MSRQLNELFNHHGTLYVYCSSIPIKQLFTKHLAEQSFHFQDGATPSRRQIDQLMCVHRDYSICFCGFISRMQCGNLQNPVYVTEDCYDGCTRIDYERFINGMDDYVILGQRPTGVSNQKIVYW